MKQLIYQNLRRCYGCKNIFPLSYEYFYRNKKQGGGFCYLCKKCHKEYESKNKDRKAIREHRRYLRLRKNLLYLFRKYKKAAKERKYIFNLTFDQFKKFWQKPCYYCGDKIETIGLDRIDNNKGYEMKNIISCCRQCNYLKGNRNRNDFIMHCKKIVNYLN